MLWLEGMLLTGPKVNANKVVTLNLVLNNAIFIQQCFVLPITNPIILGIDFLDTHFAVVNIGVCTITLGYADYMIPTSLNHDPVHD